MDIGKDAILYLRADLSEAEAKAILAEASRLIGNEDVPIEKSENLPFQAILQNKHGDGKIWDSKLSQLDVSFKLSRTDEDNHFSLRVRLAKSH